MLLRQMEYFQAVVQTGSFSEAAERCHISQSAVSQQIKALEQDLCVQLLERHNRTFSLTPEGELFYRKSAVVLADIEKLRQDLLRVGGDNKPILRIGYLSSYSGPEFQNALADFSEQYPDVELDVRRGTHEDLYDLLRHNEIDVAFNDQRRAFSDQYVNFELARAKCFVEFSSRHPFAKLDRLEAEDLKNDTCILIAGTSQQKTEEEFYREYVGFRGDYLLAENLQEARLLVAAGRGFLPVENVRDDIYFDASIARIPLYNGEDRVLRNYCLFWKPDNSGFYVETFADILKTQFE